MKNYLHINDLTNLQETINEALAIKKDELKFINLGKGKTICLLFFNNSLRTRLSTQKAAQNLGLNTIVMNFGTEGWQLEYEEGIVMNQNKAEHVKEAAEVVAQYCDIVAIRAFASLTNKEQDQAEMVMQSFKKYAGIPVVNMESATGHPLQALADAITMKENETPKKPKVVLSWAPHPRALPHAVANSFIDMVHLQDADFIITHPKGYELDPEITKNTEIEYDQEKAFENADFIYVKNWSSFKNYGAVLNQDEVWMITQKKMDKTNKAKFMHCLPVRRNVVVADEVIDSKASVVIEQANNRTYAAQIVLKKYWNPMSNPILKIVKIGGNIINDKDALASFLADFAALNGLKILVHGGGKKASEVLNSMGITPKMIYGRRVTDKATLEVVTMVYAGLLNKSIVSKLQQLNCNAIGLSGADGNSIQAHKRIVKEIDYGFAGDVDAVNSDTISGLMELGLIPVFCAITHDKNGVLLNTNADTIATELAIAMSDKFKVELDYIFELKGVLRDIEDKNSVIDAINSDNYKQLVSDGIISDGMLPKMHNCFNALKKGVHEVVIGDATVIQNDSQIGTRLRLK